MVHGLLGWGDEDLINSIVPYWGMTAGSMARYLNGKGYDVHVASVGPVSSAWDRCCELFAQMAGTRVDYGQAHVDKCCARFEELGYDLHHDRYGRDYTGKPIIENWGPIYENGKLVGWNETKVNLIGHSLGGPTITEFLNLLAEGDPAEIAWGKQQAAQYGGDWHDYISPLFWGDYDGEYLVNSLTTLAGVLNGTTFISANRDETAILTKICMLLGNALGVTDLCPLYDFQLEHFGLTQSKSMDAEAYFSYLARKGFIEGDDQAWYDLSIAGCNELKQGWKTYDNVYYFGYAGDKTYETLAGTNFPDPDMWLLFKPFSSKIGSYTNRYEFVQNCDGTRYGYIDESWLPNDGMVNSISARYPLGLAHKEYDSANIEPGIWQYYPDQNIDHLGFSGGILNSKPIQCREFYLNMMKDIAATNCIYKDAPVNPFADVADDAVYLKSVLWAYNNDITSGVDDTHFAPNSPCSRGQVVTFLWRAAGRPEPKSDSCPSVDVSKTSPFRTAITWAVEKGIVSGYDATHFGPNDTVTRGQFVTFLWRYNNKPAAGGACPFADVAKDSPYRTAITWAAEQGITKGYDATHFGTNDLCSRWHVVQLMYNDMAK